MSRNTVHEGWLTKSPPNRRIWRTRWRRRWFSLRQSGELPGQYFLDYYADRNCRRLKGTINLDLCEQVDAGLRIERQSHAPFNPKIRGSVFTIQTQRRTYHLQADCESEMEKWVDAICRVCGLRSTQDTVKVEDISDPSSGSSVHHHYECIDGTGPYIPISECITGVRAQDEQRAFTFDQQLYSSQLPLAELSDNESNLSDEEEMSLNSSQHNIHWSVTKSFTKLSVSKKNGGFVEGPPVPPRPPKTLTYVNRIQEPTELPAQDNAQQQRARVPRMSQGGLSSPPARMLTPLLRTDDEEDSSLSHSSLQYSNLPSLPPAVDRALKPRYSSVSVGHVSAIMSQGGSQQTAEEVKPDALQYLDLDLTASTPAPSKGPQKRKVTIVAPGDSPSAAESDSAYKTVDFVKTEAFNITRQDAEASRSFQN